MSFGRLACMRDVKEVQLTSAFLCWKKGEGGGLYVRERSEFPQYQTYQLDVWAGLACAWLCNARLGWARLRPTER